jgi:glycosyltransferase involved in cell wall biosynthesis
MDTSDDLKTASHGSKPLKVCHIITSTQVGGAETQLKQLIQASDPARLEHHVMSLEPLGELACGIKQAGALVASLNLVKNPLCIPGGFIRLRACLKKTRPHVIHTWMYHADLMGILAAKSLGRKEALWSLRCSNLDLSRYSRATKLVVSACSRLSSWPALIVANSQAGRDWHVKLGYPREKMLVVPNGIDPDLFRPDQEIRQKRRVELGLRDDDFLVGHVGRHDPAKDHAGLLKAFCSLVQEIPRARLLLIGQGLSPDNPVFAACAEPPLAGRCFLLGRRLDVADWYPAMDAFVSSSLSEGLPNVVAEAMSCAVAPVVTDAGDSRIMVGDCGLVVPPGRPGELSRALKRMMQMPLSQRLNLGLAARRRIESGYSVSAMLQATMEVYRRMTPHAH